MFGFTPKTRKHDKLDNSEMISLLGSSVDNEQVNLELVKFGALDSQDELSFNPLGAQDNSPISANNLGAFVADKSIHNSSIHHTQEPSKILEAIKNQRAQEDEKIFDIDSLPDSFATDSSLKAYEASTLVNSQDSSLINAKELNDSQEQAKLDLLFKELEPQSYDDEQGSFQEVDALDDNEDFKGQAEAKELELTKASEGSLNDELSFKVEQVSNDDNLPKVVILDEADALREANSQKRVSAQVNDILTLAEEKKSKTEFALIGQNLYNVQKDEDNLLSYEKEEFGKIEAEDFITGNVTVLTQTLRTGTDNVVIAAPAQSQSSYEQDDSAKEVINEVDFEGPAYGCSITLSLPNDSQEDNEPRLLPLLLRDFGVHWLTYGLAIAACILCLLKVYQVQETRNLTARLNEVVTTNADLEKQWLLLVASRQMLSDPSKIRASASDNLGMVSPKTEKEKLISLNSR